MIFFLSTEYKYWTEFLLAPTFRSCGRTSWLKEKINKWVGYNAVIKNIIHYFLTYAVNMFVTYYENISQLYACIYAIRTTTKRDGAKPNMALIQKKILSSTIFIHIRGLDKHWQHNLSNANKGQTGSSIIDSSKKQQVYSHKYLTV